MSVYDHLPPEALHTAYERAYDEDVEDTLTGFERLLADAGRTDRAVRRGLTRGEKAILALCVAVIVVVPASWLYR